MKTNNETRIGIMSQENIRERMLNIARGVNKPEPNEPKIWFTSVRSLAEVLSDENSALSHVIKDDKLLKAQRPTKVIYDSFK